jgi:AmmeMemoRadiSam system protein B
LAAYRTSAARDNRTRYPAANVLRSEIEKIVAAGSAAPLAEVRGLIAPHLDYARGAPCYADAYATLEKAPRAERFVILGTNHAGRAPTVVATSKDFVTPLGTASTDREFIEKLEERLGCSLREHEADHLVEHSIELQVHFLQTIMGDARFEIVPVLCGVPPELIGCESIMPRPSIIEFADALGHAVAANERRTVVIAGADLSHIGMRFGDGQPTTPESMTELARSDQELLTLMEQRRDDEFLRTIVASGNTTRVCSVGCLHALLRALPERPCRVLSYHQASDYENHTHVTCAAAVVS